MGSPNNSGLNAKIENESQPWLDPNGQLYSDDALREISKEWAPETWTRFLDSTVDRPNWTEEEQESETSGNELHAYIRRLMRDHLTPQQQQVIRLTFWKNLSQVEIAKILGVTNVRVLTIKRQSLSKLKGLLESRVNFFSKGRDINNSTPKGEMQNEPTSVETACESIRSDLC